MALGRNREFGYITFPDGAVSSPTTVTATAWIPYTPQVASDGRKVARFVYLQASNPVFNLPVTLAMAQVSGYTNQSIYAWNETSNLWEPIASSDVWEFSPALNQWRFVSGAAVSHFSWYGIGGDPITTSTPASSVWTLSLATMAALGVALVVRRRGTACTD